MEPTLGSMERVQKPGSEVEGGVLDLRARGRSEPGGDTASRLLRELSRAVSELLDGDDTVIAADSAQLAEVHYWLARSRRLEDVAGWEHERRARRTG